MKQNKFFKFSVIALSIVLIACSGGTEAGCPETDGRSLNVVVTTPMMGEFVSQVAGDNVNLTILMPTDNVLKLYSKTIQSSYLHYGFLG